MREGALSSKPDQWTLLSALFEQAVHAVSPATVMPDSLPPSPGGRTLVIAIGKAAAEMMRVAQFRSPAPLEGLVITGYGHLPAVDVNWPGVEIIEASHPIPDDNSLRGGRRALELARQLGPGDQMLVLLSGGGSALAAVPVEGITLEDKQQITRALLHSGASIGEFNCVRKHLSALKGGRLALAAGGARVTTSAISDVPGDNPSLIASGPTVGDPTNLAMARDILARFGITAPPRIAQALLDPANETPDPDSPALMGSEFHVIATARSALDAAAQLAIQRGVAVTDLGDRLEGEARTLGVEQARLTRALAGGAGQRVVLSGGETTVTLASPCGRGGRNLEYLLSLAIALDEQRGISAIACDTDGIDGSSDAAGAMIFPDTLARARAIGLDPGEHLARHASHDFFEALGDLVVTGPTLTNVNDFRAILID